VRSLGLIFDQDLRRLTCSAVPEQVSIAMEEIAADMREGLLALAVGAGRQLSLVGGYRSEFPHESGWWTGGATPDRPDARCARLRTLVVPPTRRAGRARLLVRMRVGVLGC